MRSMVTYGPPRRSGPGTVRRDGGRVAVARVGGVVGRVRVGMGSRGPGEAADTGAVGLDRIAAGGPAVSARVSRRRVHDQRRRQERTDLIAWVSCALILGAVGAWLLMVWAVSGGWVQ